MSGLELTWPLLLGGLSLFFLCTFLLTTGVNLLFFPRLKPPPDTETAKRPRPGEKRTSPPRLSICIPARNEAEVIEKTIRQLLAQTGEHIPSFELLVLDDHSTDQTGQLVAALSRQDQRVRMIKGEPLPAGWLGKNWACQQLATVAQGELLLFCDADVTFAAGALDALLYQWETLQGDLLTVWPTQQTESWAERLVVPLMKFTIISYLPILAVHYLEGKVGAPFAAANGQTLLFRRSAYQKIGGHTAVRSEIVEDITFAKLIKKARFQLRMADGGGLISCRMYRDWHSVRSGFGKNILAGHGGSPLALAISTGFHWLLFLVPWALLLTSRFGLGLSAIGITILMRAAGERFFGRPWRNALLSGLLMPLSVLLMTAIAWQGVRWHYGQGPEWKGRVLATPNNR